MAKKYLLGLVTVLLAIVLCACQSTSQSHDGKDKKSAEDRKKKKTCMRRRKNKDQKDWVTYKGDVAHVFYHPLITEPKVAFTGTQVLLKGIMIG